MPPTGKSRGSSTRWIDPSRNGCLYGYTTRPWRSMDRRCVAIGGRVIERHRRSRRPRWWASQTLAACHEKPARRASKGISSDGNTVVDRGGLQQIQAGARREVQVRMDRIGNQQAAPFQYAYDAPAEGVEQMGQLKVGGSSGAVEGCPCPRSRCRPRPRPCHERT